MPGYSLPPSHTCFAYAAGQRDRALRSNVLRGGGRPHSRSRKFSDWHAGGAHNTVHHAFAPAAHGRPWEGRCTQEWTSIGWSRCRGRPRCYRRHNHGTSCGSSPLFDLGSGRGDGSTCTLPNQNGTGHLFLRSATPPLGRLRCNGLLRQYFPKGTDLSRHRINKLRAVAHALNTRPLVGRHLLKLSTNCSNRI